MLSPTLTPIARRALAAVSLLSCLAAARPARADGVASVRVEADGADEVFARTDEVTSVPVRTGRFGMRMTRSPVYATICSEVPCARELAEGTYHLALSNQGGDIVEADDPVYINGATTIHAQYSDRSAWRSAGVATLVLVPLGGAALMFIGEHSTPTPTLNPAAVGLGIGVMIAGLVAGLEMLAQHDSATFTVSPLAVGALPTARENLASAIPSGLELTMRF